MRMRMRTSRAAFFGVLKTRADGSAQGRGRSEMSRAKTASRGYLFPWSSGAARYPQCDSKAVSAEPFRRDARRQGCRRRAYRDAFTAIPAERLGDRSRARIPTTDL